MLLPSQISHTAIYTSALLPQKTGGKGMREGPVFFTVKDITSGKGGGGSLRQGTYIFCKRTHVNELLEF